MAKFQGEHLYKNSPELGGASQFECLPIYKSRTVSGEEGHIYNLPTSNSADTITLRRLPTFNIFTLHGYSEIYPGAVVVAEIPVVAESTEGITRSAAWICVVTQKIHEVQLKKGM